MAHTILATGGTPTMAYPIQDPALDEAAQAAFELLSASEKRAAAALALERAAALRQRVRKLAHRERTDEDRRRNRDYNRIRRARDRAALKWLRNQQESAQAAEGPESTTPPSTHSPNRTATG